MMKTHINRRRGQALVEFSLILPLLILLIFGIIEMARLMQTWVTLQNSARAATRYAAIGAIKWDIFDVTLDIALPQDTQVLDAVVPCVLNDERGTKDTSGIVQRYTGGSESLFATWYDGMNCDPRLEDHQQFRRDILRIFSVINEARTVSSGLGLSAAYNGWDWDNIAPANADDMLYDVWTQPYPGEREEAGYFYVDVCADRAPIHLNSLVGNAAGAVQNSGFTTRFATLRNETDKNLADTLKLGYADSIPMCMLNEAPALLNGDGSPNTERLDNRGHRWWDAGGPGERVVVFLRFNHPWITPINADGGYVTLQTRRSSINESFRAPKAVGAFQRSLPPGQDDDATPITRPTATETPIPSPTSTATNTPPATATPTRIPFDCASIRLIWADEPFSGNTLYVSILNNNLEAITLTSTVLNWYSSPSYPAMYAKAFALDNTIHWQGDVPVTTPQESVNTSSQGTFYPAAYRVIGGQNAGVWSAVFLNGPVNMSVFSINDFEAELNFQGPTGQNCTIRLLRPVRPEPTATLTPTVGPSPTRTPDCATNQDISVAFGGYDSFDGSVYFNIINSGVRVTYLTGFDLVWPDARHPQIGRTAGDYYMRRVTVGGDSPSDVLTQAVWNATAPNQDASGNMRTAIPFDFGTRSVSGEGTWLGNAIIRPGTTKIFFDFDGFPGNLQTAMGVQRHHFNGSLLYIGCNFLYTRTPGGSGGTYAPQSTGVIGILEPSPTITNTPRPTNTTGPTATRTPITPTPIRTATRTPIPTATFTPSNTPSIPTRTPLPGITLTSGGGGET